MKRVAAAALNAMTAGLVAACSGADAVPSMADACPQLSEPTAFCAMGSRQAMFERDDLSASLRVSPVAGLTGVGPIEGLQGEVTAYDGELFLSSLDETGAEIRLRDPSVPAVFFAGGTVRAWTEIESEAPLLGLEAVEAFVRRAALEAGLDLDTPFAFRMEGTAAALGYHVIFKADASARPHTMPLHRQSKVPFRADGDRVRLAGVWADDDGVGRYTHPGRHTHLHVVTSENRSGHVDRIELAAGAVLFLPAPQ
ncbi:MAG: hypothetical protein WBG08_04155 [Litorimonas sp.]